MNSPSPTATGRVGVLISNESLVHTPAAWAQVVTAGIINLDPNMPPERQALALRMKQRVQGVLEQCFHEVQAASSANEIKAIAHTAASRVRDIFVGTPWQVSIDHPQIAAEIEQHIVRNLMSAADHALFAE